MVLQIEDWQCWNKKIHIRSHLKNLDLFRKITAKKNFISSIWKTNVYTTELKIILYKSLKLSISNITIMQSSKKKSFNLCKINKKKYQACTLYQMESLYNDIFIHIVIHKGLYLLTIFIENTCLNMKTFSNLKFLVALKRAWYFFLRSRICCN